MFGKRDTDVLVVGAGPVGLYTALACADRGLKTRIIDEERRTAAHSYCLALHPHSLELLDEMGLANRVIERGRRIERVAIYDGPICRAEMSLSELSGAFPFVLALPQNELEEVLEEELRHRKTKVEWNHRLSRLDLEEAGIHADVDKLDKVSSGYATAQTEWIVQKRSELAPHAVIGADGHRSFVRRSLGLEYESFGEPVIFAVFECECDLPLADELHIILDEGLTTILWPLPGNRCRWSFEMPNGESPEAPREKSRLAVRIGNETYWFLDQEHLQNLLRKRAPSFTTRVGDVHWSVLVQFQRHLTTRFGRDLAWLVGDAAHQTGPAGMQSMNVGLREVHDLVPRLQSAIPEADPKALESLDEYNAQRSREWRLLLGLDAGPVARPEAEPWVAENAARILPCVPASGPDLEALLGQIGLALAPADSRSPSA